jgi:predicted nucleic acid-binding protein
MLIIADSSALIALAACQCLELLDQLFDEVKVPQSVFDEVIVEGKHAADQLRNYLQGKIISADLTTIIINAGGLGRGELEAMALYKQSGADYLLVDDKRARRVAKLNQIEITGSQGILLLAKQEGLISAVKPFIERLTDADIYIHERVVSRVLQLAHEAD